MESKSFCYWLMGLFELADPKTLNEKQVQTIKNHLNLVFYHEIDPSYTDDKEKIKEMNEIHSGENKSPKVPYLSEENFKKLKEEMENSDVKTFRPKGGIFPSEHDTILRC